MITDHRFPKCKQRNHSPMKTEGIGETIQLNEINCVNEITNRMQNVNTYFQLINAIEQDTGVVREMANQRSERKPIPEGIYSETNRGKRNAEVMERKGVSLMR